MTARNLTKPLLKAGAKLRDQAITMTGIPALKRPVTTSSRGAYNTKKVSTYGSSEQVYLIPEWNEARLSLDILDFSEEEDTGVEASVRMCDEYEEGEVIEFSIEYATSEQCDQHYKVTKVLSKVHNNVLTKRIRIVPYRTDNF